MKKVIALALGIVFSLCGCGNPGGTFGTCDNLKAKWQASGGDPKGAWDLNRICHRDYANPWEAECPEAKAKGTLKAAASLEIGADTIRFGASTLEIEADFEIPTESLATIGAVDCQGIEDQLASDPDALATCTEDGQTCKCHFEETDRDTGSQEPYSIFGTNLVIGATGDEDSIPFCVKGSEMAWKMDPSDEGIEFFIFKKK